MKPKVKTFSITVHIDGSFAPKVVTFELPDTAGNRTWLKNSLKGYKVEVKS